MIAVRALPRISTVVTAPFLERGRVKRILMSLFWLAALSCTVLLLTAFNIDLVYRSD